MSRGNVLMMVITTENRSRKVIANIK